MRSCIPAAVLCAAAVAAPVVAQHEIDPGIRKHPTAPVEQVLEYSRNSGALPNAAETPSTIFSELIEVPGAMWLRVYFGEASLPHGSFVRITSLLDGEVQELDAGALTMWGNSSAYFNGNRVLVELVGGAATVGNSLEIEQVGFQPEHEPAGGSGVCGICGTSDDRVSSSEEWAARLFPAGCTASVYNTDSCMVSAGHCVGGNMVVQFNVPNSNFNCSTNNPPIADQFPASATASLNGGVGADWSVLSTGTNNLGERPYDRYGVLRPIAGAPVTPGTAVAVWGYGVDQTCVLSQTQQTASGTICQTLTNHYLFNVDITGGNSGSALIHNDEIIGIVTHCPCCNVATRVDRADFAAAIGFCPPPDPTPIATGNNATADGYLLIAPDAYGAWAPPFSGGTGSTTDFYNPVGAGGNQVVAFTSGLQMYVGAAKALLSTSGDWNGTLAGTNLTLEVTQEVVTSDMDLNGTDDTADSSFQVSGGGAGVALTFDLHQHVEQVSLGPAPVSVLTQEYAITNVDDTPVDFLLVRSFDGDLLWNGDFSNDNVGTGTNGSPDERYVYMSEAGDTATAVTLSSPQGTNYCGGKHGVDPDGAGGSPAYNFGTDVQVWDNDGLPAGWQNHVAGVGYDTDGDSGASPPGSTDPRDGFMHLEIPVSLAGGPGPGSSTTVVIHHTYGHNAPVVPEEPCPWDCDGSDDGNIGIEDFLSVVGTWGEVGAPCDLDGNGVGIEDFLKILAMWGPCP